MMYCTILLTAGYPEHMIFADFISRYCLLSSKVSTQSIALVDQKSMVEEILNTVGVDKSNYRTGLSQV